MKIRNSFIIVLMIFASILIINYVWDNYLVSILLFLLLSSTGYYFYNKHQDVKIVIQKKQVQKYYSKRNLNNYYIMFLEISNLNTYSQFYDIDIGDEILSHIYDLLNKHFSKHELYMYRTDQIVIVQEFKNTRVINAKLRYDEQFRNASKLLHFLKRQNIKLDDDIEYEINLNIGVSSLGIQKEERTVNELIRLAHFSMIKAKEQNSEILVASEETRAIKSDLDSFNTEMELGFKLDEFSPYFHPIIEVKTMKIVGVESLVRWRKNKYRVIEASKFKDIAIEKQMFVKIDMRVIQKTFINYQKWQSENLVAKEFLLVINISYKTLIEIKPQELITLADKYNVSVKNVEFDITERSVTSEEGLIAISKLKQHGFRFSLDTFNDRCFSFQTLIDLDIDTIKIDKSNLPNTEISGKKLKFYESIVSFSKSLNLNIQSKGIENKHHLKIAQQLNVDYAQGYYFTKPLDDEQIIIYLNKYKNGILSH